MMTNMMTKYILRSTLILPLLTIACSGPRQDERQVTRISIPSILSSTSAPSEKAEDLAVAAEDLMEAQAYEEAAKVSELAVQQNPQNVRANFVKVTSRLMAHHKGIVLRVKPLAQKHSELLKVYNEEVEKLKAKGKLYSFFMDGEPNYESVVHLQQHLDETIQRFEDIRLFAKKYRDSEVKMKGSSLMVPDMIERYALACEVKESETMVYELVCPSVEDRFYVKFNRADFESLKAAAAYYQMYFTLYNAYDARGSTNVIEKYYDEKEWFNSESLDELLKDPRFGTLRGKARLVGLKDLGLDLVDGLNWFKANHNSLCRKGISSPQNRPGMWLNEGFCGGAYLQPYIDVLSMFLQGGEMEMNVGRNDQYYRTQHRGVVLLTNPMKDIRQLGPIRMNKCAHITSIGDPTVLGALPKGDANFIFPYLYPECQ